MLKSITTNLSAYATRPKPVLLLSLLALFLISLSHAARVQASATLYVSPGGSDSNPCTASLPCLTIAHALLTAAPGDTIHVDVGTYTENLTLAMNVNIHGADRDTTIIDGGGGGTVILVNGGVAMDISTVTIRNGAAFAGAGIRNNGALTLSHAVLSDNHASNVGGGIFNAGTLTASNISIASNTGGGAGFSNVAVMTLSDADVSGNSAGPNGTGGGLQNTGLLTMVNVTISSNTAAGGGSLANFSSGTLHMTNVTIVGNSSGGLQNAGIMTVKNSILADALPNETCSPFSIVTSEGHNLTNSATCANSLTAAGDIIGTDPQLGPLQNNGGETKTHALLPGSPAIDAGTNDGCPSTDQRGVIRPQSTYCDIGAYEFDSNPNHPPAVDTGSDATIVEGNSFDRSGSFTDPDPDSWTATVDYGDSSDSQPLSLDPDKTFTLSHTYSTAGVYEVTVTITDDKGGSGVDTAVVTVLTPQAATNSITATVQSLVAAGILNAGQGNAVIAKLDAALQQLDNGNVTTAIHQLHAFINQVNDLINQGVLSSAQGQPLINAANEIITALQS